MIPLQDRYRLAWQHPFSVSILGRTAAPVGADMLDTTETDTLVSVHKHIVFHALVSYATGFPLNLGATNASLVVQTVSSGGAAPCESHHESRSIVTGFLFSPLPGGLAGWRHRQRHSLICFQRIAASQHLGVMPESYHRLSSAPINAKICVNAINLRQSDYLTRKYA